MDPGFSESFGVLPGQKNHPRTGSSPGYGDTWGSHQLKDAVLIVLSVNGPTGIKSNSRHPQIPPCP